MDCILRENSTCYRSEAGTQHISIVNLLQKTWMWKEIQRNVAIVPQSLTERMSINVTMRNDLWSQEVAGKLPILAIENIVLNTSRPHI